MISFSRDSLMKNLSFPMHRMKTIEELDFAKNDVGLNSSFISLSFFFSKLGTAIFLFLIVVIK